MTQEDKQLLLKDICARLPYFENWVQYEGKDYIVTGYGHGRVSLLPSLFSSSIGPCPLIEEVKPYLRPMSSMTKEEEAELMKLGVCEYAFHNDIYDVGTYVDEAFTALSWLFERHFDVNGLLEKDLAIEAPEGMYNL